MKSIYEVAEWFKDPIKKFTYKLSPALTAIGRQIWPSRYQQDYKGWESIPDRAIDFTADVATPIQAEQIFKAYKGKKHPWGATLPFFGMPTSKVKAGAEKKAEKSRAVRDISKLLFNNKKDEATSKARAWNAEQTDPRQKIYMVNGIVVIQKPKGRSRSR